MERIMRFVKRAAGILVFAFVSFFVLAYGMGKFDFIFIKRKLPISGMGNYHIEEPSMSHEDKVIEEQIGNIGIGENISGVISSPSEKGDDENGTESGDESGEVPSSAREEYYPSLGRAMSAGYDISIDEYIADGDHVLAELLLGVEMTKDQIKGKETVLVDDPILYEEGGEYFYNASFSEEYCFSFDIYMGYVLMYDDATVTLFDSYGNNIATYGRSEIRPAYARDDAGEPLFIDFEGRYFVPDEYGRKIYSSYVDESDSKGIYFNYRKDLGTGNDIISVFCRNEDVRFVDEIDTKDYYIRSSIDPKLAKYIYALRPSFADTVAKANPRFAEELKKEKERIEDEKRLEEEKKTEQLVTESETLLYPETESISDNADTAEMTADSEISPPIETITDTAKETETEIETDTETERLTSSNPDILIIDRTLTLLRYGYGHPSTDPDEIEYKYAKAYGFSEGRAAVVDDKGILRFINPNGEVVIDGVGMKMVTASRYIVTEYAEPLYRHSENSKGYLYFDSGLVRVRKLERDYTFRNLIYSDSDVLIYPDGSEFDIPRGFTLVSYSEGVLVLKGNDQKYGYYHKDGYWIAQPIYTEIRPFSEGLGVIGFQGGKKGVIDKNGNIVIPFAYEYITAPSDGIMALYSYENGWKILVKTSK